MSETEPTAMDVEIEQPHLAHDHLLHQHPARHWIDYAVPISALFISMISIFVAWEHGQVMKQLVEQNAKMVRANSLPYIELNNGNTDPKTGKPLVYFSVINRGVGPAQVHWAQVLFDGRPVDLDKLMQDCCGTTPKGTLSSQLSSRMFQAGEEIPYLALGMTPQSKPAADALFKAYGDGRMVTKICYCSLFNECWVIASGDPAPTAVRQCAPVKMTYEGTPSGGG